MNGWDRRRIVTVLAIVALAAAAGVTVFRLPLQSIFVLGVALVCPLLMAGMHAGGHGPEHEGTSAPMHAGHDVAGPTKQEADR